MVRGQYKLGLLGAWWYRVSKGFVYTEKSEDLVGCYQFVTEPTNRQKNIELFSLFEVREAFKNVLADFFR